MLRNLFDSPTQLLILVLVIVVVFGWKRLPDAARSLGRSARILKSEVGEMNNESKAAGETVPGERAQASGSTPAAEAGPVPGESRPAAPAPGRTHPTPGAQQHPAGEGYQPQPGQQSPYPQQPPTSGGQGY